MSTIIAFVSQKGGVGKSTLARALAREAAAGGFQTKIADLDTQQATSVDWHRIRLGAGIEPVVAVEAFATANQALKAAGKYDLLIRRTRPHQQRHASDCASGSSGRATDRCIR